MDSLEAFIRKYLRSTIRPTFDANAISTNEKDSRGNNSKMDTVSESQIVEFMDTNTNRTKSKVTNFLKLYFDFAYFSGCCPFRFALDGDSKLNTWFKIKTWRPQQIICALLHSIGTVRLITEVRRSIPNTFSPSPEQYFAVIGSGFRILFKGVTLKRFWRNRTQFLDIVNYLAVNKLPDRNTKLESKYTISCFCVMCVFTPLVIGIKNYIIATPSVWEKTWWNRTGLVNDGRFTFFMTEEYKLLPEPANLNLADYFFAILMGIGLLERFIMGFFFDASLLLAVLTLWSTAYAFAGHLRHGKEVRGHGHWTDLSLAANNSLSKWPDIYSAYKGIRVLSFLINNAYGSMVTLYLADTILYHSMNLDAIVLTNDIFLQVYLLFFVVNSVMVLLLSADICNQMDALKIWLSKDDNRRMVPLDELNIVLHELNTRGVGIRGSNIFTITYSLVWNMLTTVVTYFIICVQSRGSTRIVSSGQLM